MHASRPLGDMMHVRDLVAPPGITILSNPVYRGFGPTLAAEYLHQRHQITVSKETLRKWMSEAGLWKARKRRVEAMSKGMQQRLGIGQAALWLFPAAGDDVLEMADGLVQVRATGGETKAGKFGGTSYYGEPRTPGVPDAENRLAAARARVDPVQLWPQGKGIS